MQYNWDWGVLLREPYLEWIWSGFLWTMATGCAAWVIAISLGSVIGVMRTTNVIVLRRIGTAYVELFRNIPLLVQMVLWYFVFPEILPNEAGMW
ncbi:MAG: ABC transporter permease subunit, partial [Alphaproteobacteria bacterium]|nr:ABC transporter permease subunit [Alphaproteobacteria bacterium]